MPSTPSDLDPTPVPGRVFLSLVDALEIETERVLADVLVPLKGLVTLRLQPASSRGALDAAQPVLTLHFARPVDGLWRFWGRNGINTKRITAALDAVTLVCTHVKILKHHSKLSAKFWGTLLDSEAMKAPATGDTRAQLTGGRQLAVPEPPLRIVLAFGSRRAKLDRKWFDALYKFLTDQCHQVPPEFTKQFPDESKKIARTTKIFFGLCFANSSLSVASLVMIQRLLDCVVPGYNRHFGIDMLDLSKNAMTAAHLDIVTMILKRNVYYRIDDIRLDEIIKTPLVPQESAKVQDLLAAAFVVTRIPTETNLDLRATRPRISLATNSLGVEHFISLCSAHRYGCVFDELSLASMISRVASKERELCWRWLAFGVFFPRSSRFAALSRLRKIEVLHLDISSKAVEAFANALYNPVAELRRPGHPEDSRAIDAVLVGVIQKGAVVYSLADVLSSRLLTLTHTQELEILHSRDDTAWVCVVVPGMGLGWIESDDVLSVESDLEDASGATAARFDLVVRGEGGSRAARALSDEAHTFIETVGRQLRSLAVRDSGSLSLQDIVYHCMNLQHLDLEGCDLQESSFSDLHGCLHGHFGKRIVSLNLNRTGLTAGNVVAIAKLLNTPQKLPLLRELRLHKVRINRAGLERLHAALARNKTLAVLGLEDPGEDLYEAHMRTGRARIDADYQNELLAPVPLSVRQRLALLSAFSGPNTTSYTGEVLEPALFASIFRFVEEPARRRIIWSKPDLLSLPSV